MAPKIFIISIFALSGVLAGCGTDDVDTEATRDTIEQAGQSAQDAAREGMASLRTDAERFVDEIQTRNAPEAKQQLLDRCRDALERMRKAGSNDADRVAGICDRIQNSDVQNRPVWDEIKQEIEKIP